LYDRIAVRVNQMVERGWVAEVEDLLRQGICPSAPAFRAIGYRQLVQHIRGECGLYEAIEDTVRATRRYAKRQMTWFRKEAEIRWLSVLDIDAELPALLHEIQIRGAFAR
jgi:tRNA dimethylallyltransferase